MVWLLGKLLPGQRLTRRLAISSGVYAVGTGTFLAGNAVFFTHVVGLRADQVGLGLSVAGVVAVLTSVPAGRLADRVGHRRLWWLVALGESAVYLSYPWIRGLLAFLLVVAALAVMESAGRVARAGYALASVPQGERVEAMAYIRSALNIGFTAGALLSGVFLAFDSDRLIQMIPLVTAGLLLIDVFLIRSMPAVEPVAPAVREATGGALRNRPFLLLGLLSGQLGVTQVLLSVVFPLWILQQTDAPRASLAWLYGTNTILVVLFQVRVARGTESVRGALTAARRSSYASGLACVLAAAAHQGHGGGTLMLLLGAYVALTAGELYNAASSWGLVAELSDPVRRGEYQGLWRVGMQLQMIVGPAALTWLALEWRPWGLLALAGWTIVLPALMPPLARRAEAQLLASRRTGKPGGVGPVDADTIAPSHQS